MTPINNKLTNTMSNEYSPSAYQLAVLNFLDGNEAQLQKRKSLIVEAVAGSGKSTLCKMAIERMLSRGCSVAYTMFNKATVDSFKVKMGSTRAKIGTAHSFGLRALRQADYKGQIDGDKLWKLADQIFPFNRKDPRQYLVGLSVRLVEFAMQNGKGIPEIDEMQTLLWSDMVDHFNMEVEGSDHLDTLCQMCDQLLEADVNCLDMISFTDQLYFPLYYNVPFERYDYVMVDEAQDTNLLRLFMFRRMLKPWGAILAVGDQKQAIYAFQGAGLDSMSTIKQLFNAETLPLSVCYRCASSILTEILNLVPQIEPRPDAPVGSVESINYQDFIKMQPDDYRLNESVVLCRFNAPNIRLALAMVRRRIPVEIVGRDLGKGLMAVFDKLYKDDTQTVMDFRILLGAWLTRETEKAEAKKKPIAPIYDRHDALEACLEHVETQKQGLADVPMVIDHLFKAKPGVERMIFSSVHKAKGQEWPRVYILGRDAYMPSPWIKTHWEKPQEDNLIYVATTRAEETLVYINNPPK